jgi:acyl-CoA reductase-like NAD-dependent aldehyde dehydrogenase
MKMLIDGQRADALTGRTFAVRNTAAGEVIDTVTQAGPEESPRATLNRRLSASETTVSACGEMTPQARTCRCALCRRKTSRRNGDTAETHAARRYPSHTRGRRSSANCGTRCLIEPILRMALESI